MKISKRMNLVNMVQYIAYYRFCFQTIFGHMHLFHAELFNLVTNHSCIQNLKYDIHVLRISIYFRQSLNISENFPKCLIVHSWLFVAISIRFSFVLRIMILTTPFITNCIFLYFYGKNKMIFLFCEFTIILKRKFKKYIPLTNEI